MSSEKRFMVLIYDAPAGGWRIGKSKVGEDHMVAFNVVRFKVKPDMEEVFIRAHGDIGQNWPGMIHANIVKASGGRYCIIAEWESMEALAACRPQMIATLDKFRGTLEDLGGGLGVTDPIAGEVIFTAK